MSVGLTIEVGSEDLTTSRFAISPLWELTQALRLLAGRPGHQGESVLRPWLARTRERYRALAADADLDVVLALEVPGWGADFLYPEPPGPSSTIEDLLGQVRATPVEQARREINEAMRRQPAPPRVQRVLAGDHITGYIADVLTAAWHALLEPEWPVLRAIL
jgi:hypothetical protein